MTSEGERQGFELAPGQSSLTAWGDDLAPAFEAAITGLLHAAGAPLDLEPSGKSVTVNGIGKSPAELLDELIGALRELHRSGERLDGSIQMGGVIRTDEGWSGWAAAGIGDESSKPLDPFEALIVPRVERKIGRVTVKMQFMIWTSKLQKIVKQINEIFPLHPGGVIGPEE